MKKKIAAVLSAVSMLCSLFGGTAAVSADSLNDLSAPEVNTASDENKASDVSTASDETGTAETADETPAAERLNAALPSEDAQIPAGIYTIASKLDDSEVLGIAGDSFDTGARLTLQKTSGTAGQKFTVAPLGGGLYSIFSYQSGKSIDITGGGTVNGTKIQQYSRNRTAAQKFYILKDASGACIIRPSNSSLVFDVPGGQAFSGNEMQVYEYNGTPAQQFVFSVAGQESLQTGTYYIHTSYADSKVLDLAGGSTSSGGNLQIYEQNSSAAQMFTLTVLSDGNFEISPVCSALALDVAGAASSDGTNVRQYTPNASAAQKWSLAAKADGCYTLTPLCAPESCLDISGAQSADGTNAEIWTANGTAAQEFSFEAADIARTLPDGCFTIASALGASKVLDISGGSKSDGANVQIYSSNGTDAQKFYLNYSGGGRYRITNVKSGKVLDITGGSPASGANVQQYSSNGTNAQQWSAVYAGNGSYTFRSAFGTVLDVAGGQSASGTNVQAYVSNGTAAQRFTVSPTVKNLWTADLNAASSHSQLIVVAGSGTTAEVSMVEKDASGSWTQLLVSSGYIGRNGLGKTREGDGKTPVGIFGIWNPFGICDNPGTSLPYTKVDSTWYWVGDSASAYYNRMISTNNVTPSWNTALDEHLIDMTTAYRYVLPIAYNPSCTPYVGSAIFLHCEQGKPTSGCVSVPENVMISILQHLRSDCAIIIDTPENIASY